MNSPQRTFKTLDMKIQDLVSHPKCPAMVGKVYGYARDYAARAVQPPDPQVRPPVRARVKVQVLGRVKLQALRDWSEAG